MATAAAVAVAPAAAAAAVAAAAAGPQTTRVTSRQVSLPRAGSKALNCNLVGLLLLVAFAASLLVSVQLAGQAVLAPLALLRGPGGGGEGGQQVHLQVVRGGDYGPTLEEEPSWEPRSLGVGAAAGSASSRVQEEGASGGGGSGSGGSPEGDGVVTGVGRQGVGERASKEISKEDVAVPPGELLDVLADAAAADLARSSDKNGDEESSSGGFGLLEPAGAAAAAQEQQGNNGTVTEEAGEALVYNSSGEDAKTRNVTKDDELEPHSEGGAVLQLAAEETTTTTTAGVVDTTSSTLTSRSDELQVIREKTEDLSNSELIPTEEPAVAAAAAAADVHDAAPGDSSSSTTNNNNLKNETVQQQLLSQVERTTSTSEPGVVVVVNGMTQPRSSNVGSTDDDSSEAAAAAPLPSWRRRAEDELKAAKLALQDPAFTVPDDSPASGSEDSLHAPAYHNATHFRKSYHLMEQVFKTYVYAEGSAPLVHAGPLTGIYASEGQFISAMVTQAQGQGTNRLVTRDPHAAHMFFLPYSVAHMVEHLYVPGSRSMLPLATFITDYVNTVAAAHPFWNMTAGRDHFLVACHDWGPATARDHPGLRANAVKVVCNADLTEEFVPGKDASLPEVYLHKRPRSPRSRRRKAAGGGTNSTTTKATAAVAYDTLQFGGNPPAERRVLAFFAGQMHGRVRPVLLRHWKDRGDSDPDMHIYERIPRGVAKKTPYAAHMKSSRFCVCAAGYEVNSPRLVEAIYYDCVPVIVADNFVLPFSDVLDWSAFSLTVAEKDIPDLKRILLAVSDRRYREMQARLRHVRKHFVWHPGGPPQKYDAFHMVMHSVWMRRLSQVQLQD